MVEQRSPKPCVAGSSPVTSAKQENELFFVFNFSKTSNDSSWRAVNTLSILYVVQIHIRLTQLGECLPYMQKVGGSNPSTDTMACWTSWLSRHPFKVESRVQTPYRLSLLKQSYL